MAYDYDKPVMELPLPYVRELASVAEEVQRRVESSPQIYGSAFVIDRVTFWDGASGEPSEWFIDVHDDEVWISLATRLDKEN